MESVTGLREFDPHKGHSEFVGRCPFCLWEGKSRNFLLYLKGGKRSKEYKCPNCFLIFFFDSIVKSDRSIQEYAEWIVRYPAGLFFQRLKAGKGFEYWSYQLKELGIASEFWEEYRKLKPKRESSG